MNSGNGVDWLMDKLENFVWKDDHRVIRKPHEKIRQYYFRVWEPDIDARENIYTLTNLAITLEEDGYELDLKGWFSDTLDDPKGLHGVVEATKAQYKKFFRVLDDHQEEEDFYFTIRRKPGFMRKYKSTNFIYTKDPFALSKDDTEDCYPDPMPFLN